MKRIVSPLVFGMVFSMGAMEEKSTIPSKKNSTFRTEKILVSRTFPEMSIQKALDEFERFKGGSSAAEPALNPGDLELKLGEHGMVDCDSEPGCIYASLTHIPQTTFARKNCRTGQLDIASYSVAIDADGMIPIVEVPDDFDVARLVGALERAENRLKDMD